MSKKKENAVRRLLSVTMAAVMVLQVPGAAMPGLTNVYAEEAGVPIPEAAPAQAPAAVPEAAPAQAPAAVLEAAPAQAAAPVPEAVPAQAAAPVPEAVPAQEPAAVPEAVPAQATAPIPEEVPAQASAPAQEAASSQTAAAVPEEVPAQAAIPAQAEVPVQGQGTEKTQIPEEGQTAVQTQGSEQSDTSQQESAVTGEESQTASVPENMSEATVPVEAAATTGAGEAEASVSEEQKPSNENASDPEEAETKPEADPEETETKPEADTEETETKPETDPEETETKPETDPEEAEAEPETDPEETEAEPQTDPEETKAEPQTDPEEMEAAEEEEPAADAAGESVSATTGPASGVITVPVAIGAQEPETIQVTLDVKTEPVDNVVVPVSVSATAPVEAEAASADPDVADAEIVDDAEIEEADSLPQVGEGDDSSPAPSTSSTSLKDLIENAMKAVTGTLTGRLKVVLSKNVAYEDNVTLQRSDWTMADDFELELSAEDAGESGLDADGKTVYKGNLLVKGINLIIKGLGLPGKVTVEDARLSYSGSVAGDTVNVDVGSGGSADINTGDGDDDVKVANSSATGSVSVETGDGDDRVTVDAKAGMTRTDVSTGDGNDEVSVGSSDGGIAPNPNGVINVDLGSGTDRAEVDIKIANVVKEIAVKGGDNGDRLHLTGNLSGDNDRATGDETDMKLKEAGGKTLEVKTEDVETFTDELGNKKTVRLTPTDSGIMTYRATDGFTNYIYTGPSGKLKNLTIEAAGALPLSAIIIDTDETGDEDSRLVLNEGSIIDTKALALILKGRIIDVNGTIMARQVFMDAEDGIGARKSLSDLYNKYNESMNAFDAGLEAIEDAAVDMINVSDEAAVNIGKTGKIYSGSDVAVDVKVHQDGGLISLLPNLNLVNVKVAKAGIDVKGQVYAGYNFDEQKVTERGSVTMNSSILTTMGFDEEGQPYDGLPLAVSVANLDNRIHIEEGARVEAFDDVTMSAKSELKVSARANSGLGGLPAAIAVSVLNNDVQTLVDGTVTSHQGGVSVDAKGDMSVDTIASKGNEKSFSGGFAGVTVALQDVQAKLGSTAVVTADGEVSVGSVADQAVNTIAASAKQEGGVPPRDGPGKEVLDLIDMVWDQVKDKVGTDSKDKLENAFQKISSGDNSVKLDADAKKKGDVKLDTTPGFDGRTEVNVTAEPRAGYKVKKIILRGFKPGESEYQIEERTVDAAQEVKETFNLAYENVTVFVEYEEIEGYNGDSAEDLFSERKKSDKVDLNELVNDATGGANDDTGDRQQNESGQSSQKTIELKLTGKGGAVLNYETDPEDGTKSLTKVVPGREVRLIPNPSSGNKLKTGGLKVTYKVKGEDGKLIKKTIVVDKDAQNRYIFTVPADADIESGIEVTATFEAGEQDHEADNTSLQMTGTVAVSVTDNANQSIIDSGAKVSAGNTEVVAEENTDVHTKADGSNVDKTSESEPGPQSDKKAISRPASQAVTRDAADHEFGLMIDGTINGAVEYKVDTQSGKYAYVLDVKPDEGYSATDVLLVYYSGKERKTMTLTKGDDGKYAVDLLKTEGLVDKGSVARIIVNFAKEGTYGVANSEHEAQYVIANPIRVEYNGLKGDRTETGTGTMSYAEARTINGKLYYYFNASANASNGYVPDGAPKAVWVDENGNKHETELTKSGDLRWRLDPEEIPAGALITVTGSFKEDFHAVKVEERPGGSVTLHDEELKAGDRPVITAEADPGYSVTGVKVFYTDQKKYTNEVTLVKNDKGDWVFPQDREISPMFSGSEMTVRASFERKRIGVKHVNEGTVSNYDYSFSEDLVAKGDEVTVIPSEAKQAEGYKVARIKVTKGVGGPVVYEGDGDSFEVPDNTGSAEKMIVDATLELKEIAMEKAELQNGTVEPVIPRADRNESVQVKVNPADGFRVKKNTLKAVITANDGSYTEEVYMARQDDYTYSFDMPDDIEDPSAVKITFTGEFEPGRSDTSTFDTSLGAGIAVSVVNGDNRAEIRGNVESSGDIRVEASQTGGAKTESKAGYSKGDIGVGGAVSVQVASLDSRALVHNDANLSLGGTLSAGAASELDFSVSGDASGNKEAGKTGVGAGIAVAVNGSDSIAAVEDGAKLSGKGDEAIHGISVTATQKVKDEVSAIAGAAGGTAVVPVASVDVTGSSASAYLGHVSAGKLTVKDKVSVSAMNDSRHTISADASAAGNGAGVGAAIGVSVINDTAVARMNQSVDAGTVTVASSTTSTLENTATASASGGKGKKSADGQADGLLDGASKLAAKNNSQNVSGGKMDEALKGRQKSETSEGSVGVAGAVAVNVLSSESRSEIMNGVNIKAGDVSVTSENGTSSKVMANASTTNSDIGVGVGAAVNIINLSNLATVGDGEIEAAMLEVAAATKRTQPEEEEEKEPEDVKNEEGLKEQIGGAVQGFVDDLLAEMGLDSDFVSDVSGKVTEAAAGELIDAMGLEELLGGGGIEDKYNKAVELLTDTKDGLMGLPEKLIAPFMEAIDDAIGLGNLTDKDRERIKNIILTEFTAQLKLKVGAAGKGILESVKNGMIDYVKDDIGDILSGVFQGQFKSLFKETIDQAKKEIHKAVKNEMKKLVSTVYKDTLTRLTGEIPGLTQQNIDRVVRAFSSTKDAYNKKSVSNILDSAVNYVTTTFRDEVFDYEAMFTKIAETDFKETISESLRSAAKAAMVTLTNEAVGKLSENLDIGLEAEEKKATGHIIDTQAVSGAGARDVGVAGSVAITVLNAVTAAEIAAGRNVNVSGEMKVNADEQRYVHNVASAAISADGNAETNKSADEAAKKDVGDGNSGKTTVEGELVKMSVGIGGSASIDPGDMGDDRPKIYLNLEDGYEMPKNNVVTFTYTDKNGEKQEGTAFAKKDPTRGWYVDTSEIKHVDSKLELVMEFTPVAIAYKVPTPDVLSAEGIETGAVEVKAEDGTVKSGEDFMKTHVGDKIEVKVKKKEGRKVSGIEYAYKDADGNRQEVKLALSSETDTERIYFFEMPAGDIEEFVVAFEEGEEDKSNSETTSKDATGKGVGVGAAFSMVYGNNDVKASIGKRDITAGALSVEAASDHKEDIASAAGTDPLEEAPDEENMKKYSVDASVAFNILDNAITANVDDNARVTTVGGDTAGDLKVTAKETAVTENTASAFAVGGKTAVGASAAINISSSTVEANLRGSARAAGNADVSADSHSEDTTRAIATAMGADIARNLNKLGEKADNLEEKSNKLLDGSYLDKDESGEEKEDSTDTGKMINRKLDSKKGEKGSNTSEKASTSTNILRSMGVETGSDAEGGSATEEAEKKIKETTDKDVNLKKEQKSTKWQVAAAVGVSVASHEVSTNVGDIRGKNINIAAENTGNFNTTGTGASMSMAEHANSIAAGVAVSVNSNSAKVKTDGSLNASSSGKVNVSSKLTQNLDGDFAGKLAAQALSGSVAGKDSDVSIGGAVSVVVASGESTVDFNGGTKEGFNSITGGDITVDATEKSKIAARAGGLSLSKGSSVGIGIGSTTIVNSTKVRAEIGDNARIYADSLRLNAERQAVTFDDYKNLIDLKYVVTDSSKLTPEERAKADTGLIDIHKGEGEDNYTAKINLSSDKLLEAVDGLNFLSSQNTYAEAIAGSVMTGKAKEGSSLSLAGSVAVAVNNTDVKASLGKNTIVELSKDMKVNADNSANTRIIAGALSAAPAKASVGATISVLVNNDRTEAVTGAGSDIKTGGDFAQNASTSGETQVFTAAMSAAGGKDAKAAVGGAVNVIVNRADTKSTLGTGTIVKSTNGSASVTAKTALDLIAISGSAAVTAGSGVAAGGTVNVIYDQGKASAVLEGNNTLSAYSNTTVSSELKDRLLSGTASLSAAPASKNGKAGAGVANVIINSSAADTQIGKATLYANRGDLNVLADNDSWLLNASLAAAVGKDLTVGAAFNLNWLERKAAVRMEDGSAKSDYGGLNIRSAGVATNIMAGLSLAGSVAGSALSGNFIGVREKNSIKTEVTKGIKALAGRNAVIESYYGDKTVAVAGSIAASAGGGAYGATVVATLKDNEVITDLGSSTVTADGTRWGSTKNRAGETVKGVYIGANADEQQLIGAAGVAAANGSAFNGVVSVLVNNNKVHADASGTTMKSLHTSGGISVKARDNTEQLLLAGGLSASTGSGVGASVVTLVSNKDIKALAHNMTSKKDVTVSADNKDDIKQLAISAGASGGSSVQIGAAVQVLKSKVLAETGSTVDVQNGGFSLTANNDTKLYNIAAAVGIGSGVAATPVGAVTWFEGTADARLKSGTTVKTKKDINIKARSNKDVNLLTIGAAFGQAGISGAASVLVSRDHAKAVAESGTNLNASENINVDAKGDYKLRSASAAVAAGQAGVGVNAVVSVMKTNTTAELGGTAKAAKNVNVTASAKRDVINVVASLGAGQAGAGVSALVLVAGTKMSQDAADMIAYGNADSKKEKKGFDGRKFLNTMEKNGIDADAFKGSGLTGASLEEALSGNGHYESRESVGTSSGSGKDRKSTFDGASGYRSSDFDNKSFNDGGAASRGENYEAKDTKDIQNAKSMNTYSYTDDPTDAVIARITRDAVVEANAVDVTATQPVAADLLGAAVGAGQAGIGVSAAVAMLRSNVSASSLGTIKAVADHVNITAKSVSGKFENDKEGADRDNAILDLLSNNGDKKQSAEEKKSLINDLKSKLSPGNRAIRTFGLAAGAGQVGVAVSASVVLTDNQTQAVLGGSVENAGAVSIRAEHDYGTVLAATGSLAAGMVGAGASVSVAQTNGTVKANVVKDSDSAGSIKADSLNVKTTAKTGTDAIAVTAGAGLAAVNAGVALAFNRLKQDTGIGAGMNVNAEKGVFVGANSSGDANSYLLGVSLGGVGISTNAAVSEVDAKINTYIGKKGGAGTTVNSKGDVTVWNDVVSSAKPRALSAAVGGVAVGGNVLLAFNDTTSEASVRNANIFADNLIMTSDLEGKVNSDLAALQVGGVAVGLSVNYADIRADNRAVVEDAYVEVTNNMSVRTNKGNHNSTLATANTISGNVGLIAAGMNAAIARNNSKNYAIITGSGGVDVGKELTVEGKGKNTASANMKGLSIGLARAAVSTVVALNDADSRTVVKVPSLNVGGKANFNAGQDASTKTNIVTGGGSLMGAAANIAVAYGRADSLIDVRLSGDSKLGGISAMNNGTDITTSTVSNSSFDVISASAMVGAAYSKDVFNTSIALEEGDYRINGDVKVKTDYRVESKADVTPSAGGVKINLAELALDMALAKNTAHAGAEFTSGSGRKTRINGDLDVSTSGKAETTANINSAKITVSGAQLGASIANADLSMTQAATLRLSGGLDVDGGVNVTSTSGGAKAIATLGTSGKENDSAIKVTLFNKKTNTASAGQNLTSTASILGEGNLSKKNTLTAGSLNVKADHSSGAQNLAEARTDGAKEASLLTAGNLNANAVTSERSNVVLDVIDAKINGAVHINATSDSGAKAIGYAPGKLTIVNGGRSDVSATVGSSDDRQTARIVVGKGVRLTGNSIDITGSNSGSAEASMEKKGSYSLGSLDSSSQTTNSRYDTGLIIGENVRMAATGGALTMDTKTRANAKSVVDADSMGLLLNADKMRGENIVDDKNRLLIGSGTMLTSAGDMHLRTDSSAQMDAKTLFKGGVGLVGGSEVIASNTIRRDSVLQVGNNTTINAGGNLNLETFVGRNDNIETEASQKLNSKMEFGKAMARTDSVVRNRLTIGANANISGDKQVEICANASGGATDSMKEGYLTRSHVDATNFKVLNVPESNSYTSLKFVNEVLVNPNRGARTTITGKSGDIFVRATNKGLKTETIGEVRGDGLAGNLKSYAITTVGLTNTVWVDNTTFSGGKGTHLFSGKGSYEGERAGLNTTAVATMRGAGFERPTARIMGIWSDRIRTHAESSVSGGFNFTHEVSNDASINVKTECNGWKSARGVPSRENSITRILKCDFCRHSDSDDNDDAPEGAPGGGGGSSVEPAGREPYSGRMIDTGSVARSAFSKILATLNDIRRNVDELGFIPKSRYGEEDNEAAANIYVLDIRSILERDVALTLDRLSSYLLWTNTETQYDVYLLPNATRLYGTGELQLQYVTEVLSGDVLGTGETSEVDIITALTPYAGSHPVIPIGSTGSLNFADGTLTIPSMADFDLYLHEVSGKWLKSLMEEGTIRTLIADQDEINKCALNGEDLPQGRIVEGLVDDGEEKGLRMYWVGDTPETAETPDQVLIYLLHNEETDEIDAFRTSVNMIKNDEASIDVSLYMYRDADSDRQGEEKYNAMFFDTPEGKKSLVTVITNVLMENTLETPKMMQIVLRGFDLSGGDMPGYSISGHFFAMNDGTDGEVRMFDGAYCNTFDGNTFESDYIRIEGIADDNPNVTVKAGQPVWPEWPGEDEEEDIGGNRFTLVDNVWYPRNEAPGQEAKESIAA